MPLLALALLLAWPLAAPAAETEIREYEGRALAPFDRDYDNSIKGPQAVDRRTLRLTVTGLVDSPLSLTYDEALALPQARRVVNMPCVEGWDELLLVDGVRLADLLAKAGPKPGAKVVIFRAADGYTSAHDLDYLIHSQALLAFKINGRTLDAKRGFPFQLIAEHKLGYKWVKWVVGIELTDQPHLGYWEKHGYSNEADTPR
jgi:DMSO/TMAO reductase YedYZ molybdopterin-dependent catalytic subunit